MLKLKCDGDVTRSPEFRLNGKAMIEIVTKIGYVTADDPHGWTSEEDMIASMLEEQGVENESQAKNKIMCDDTILRRDRQETLIELQPGSSFQYGFRRPDEEGFTMYGIDVQWHDDHWEVAVTSGGRDCDGEHSRTVEYIVGADGKEMEERVEVYDQYAEAAGY